MNTTDKELIAAALEAADRAYAPYSRFRVGAAVRLEDGTIVTGNNQENIAYPSGSCAERVAVNYARATWPGKAIESLAVVSPDSSAPVSPCGGCRQLLAEAVRAQNRDFRVVMAAANGITCRTATVAELLPFGFEFSERG